MFKENYLRILDHMTFYPSSKLLALLLFTLLPFLGFYAGIQYQLTQSAHTAPGNLVTLITPPPPENPHNPCVQLPDPGSCKASIPSYYFDQSQQHCTQFTWGGCGGTRPFTTLESCQSACMNTQWKEITAEAIPLSVKVPQGWKKTEYSQPAANNQTTILISSPDFRYQNSTVKNGFNLRIGTLSDTFKRYPSFEEMVTQHRQNPKDEVVIINNIQWLRSSAQTQATTLYHDIPLTIGIEYNSDQEEQAKNILAQILSTFRFVDKESNQALSLTGIIRTSGLSLEEKQKLQLQYSKYQITQKCQSRTDLCGYYIESSIVNNEHVGQCVQITGNAISGWATTTQIDYINGQYAYGRSALHVSHIETLPLSSCLEPDTITPTPKTIDPDYPPEYFTLTGILQHANRPAPDISEDYQLLLDQPLNDVFDGSGLPKSAVVISPLNSEMTILFENNIGRRVTISGTKKWGYAETAYIQVETIKLP